MEHGWCVEEFLQAHVEALNGRNKFIILILIDDINTEELPDEMQVYIKAEQFIDARRMENQREIDLVRNKLLYAMPRVPIRRLQPEHFQRMRFPPLFHRLHNYTNFTERMVRNQRNDIEEVVEEEVMMMRDIRTGDSDLDDSEEIYLTSSDEDPDSEEDEEDSQLIRKKY